MRIGCILISLFLSAPVWAQQANDASVAPIETSSSILSVLGACIFVVTLIFVLAFILRQLQGVKIGKGQGIKVLSAYPLTPKEKLMIIEVGKDQLLLGVGVGGTRTLHHFSEPLTLEAPQKLRFDQLLAKKVKQVES